MNAGDTYVDAAGVQLTITGPYDPSTSVGAIYLAQASMGVLQTLVLVTEAGLLEAGFTLVQ